MFENIRQWILTISLAVLALVGVAMLASEPVPEAQAAGGVAICVQTRNVEARQMERDINDMMGKGISKFSVTSNHLGFVICGW